MNEERIAAYLNLIQQLLTCPSGEENQILSQSLDLVDGGFVQVCELLAQQLQEAGEENQAGFLRNLAQKVGEYLNSSGGEGGETQGNATGEEYFNFLMGLLQVEIDSDSDPKVVYPFLAQHQDKLDLTFGEILTQWFHSELDPNNLEKNQALASLLNSIAIDIKNFPLGRRSHNLEIAIASYQAALTVYTPTAFPEQWAMTQNNLGNAYSDRIKGERGENLENAIASYQAALTVYTPTAFPEQWATTQNNLGNAYLYRIKGERGENLEIAIASYQAALTVRTPTAFPEQWAMTQNNLGTAYSDRIKGERGENLENAIASYQAALTVRTPTAFPEDWATTQNNLGNAYRNRIKGERGENLENAIASYQAALSVYTPTAFPQNHAKTSFNLGLAYRDASQIQNAYDTFAAAIDTVEEIRSGITLGGEAARQKLAEEWQKLYKVTIEVCLELENYAAALEYAERSKARNLVELLAATRLKPEGVSPEVWERYDRLYQQWWNLQQQRDSSASPPDNPSPNDDTRSIALSPSTTPTPNDSQNLTQLRQQIDHFIATEITPHDPKFRFGQQVQPIRYREIQALVNEQTALVEWYLTSKGIQAFIVTHQGEHPIVVSTDSSAVAALEQLKNEYLTDYLSRDNHWRQELPSYLQRLAEILELNHLISQIPSQYQQLILIPYRALHLFPLHALPLSQTEYLSDRFPQGIRYAPSSQILQLSLSENTTSPEQRGRASIFRSQVQPGNEDLGGSTSPGARSEGNTTPPYEGGAGGGSPSQGEPPLSSSSFSPPYEGGAGGGSLFAIQNPTADLAYTDIEVEAIQTAFNPATVLPGKAANKTAFNQAITQLKETTFAHFSCHGYFNFTNPRISGLILADAKLPETAATEKGIPVIRSRRGDFNPEECLTLPEIFNLRLRNCRLVALSACETGITDISTTSDEYISILAGFFFAGSRNVLGTLWAVNDVSTAIFMIRFYETLLGKSQPPAALALKKTQEWMRSTTVAELLDWIKGCQLINQERRKAMCYDLTLGWRKKLDVKRYESPYYWAAFCAVGQ
ncbi:CHAT domain-containing protein [Floridanema evergladense]|uniref:CHAT domain-containing protein n=1 Tax=Floridaenema evergladense BLCC-F167 TaxID=3153639 RepID=A0ABV4WMG4_9CYAN